MIRYLLLISLLACNSGKAVETELKRKHMVEIHKNGIGSICIDKVSSTFVMNRTDLSSSEFSTFLVSLTDSVQTNSEQRMKTDRYYQYDMQNEWVSIINNDTLKPVFFQPEVQLNPQRHSFILVFENSAGRLLDTLLYHDSFGGWGIRKIIF